MLFDAGVVHLKMRPSNILISNGKYKLTDVEYKIRTYSSMDNEGEITKNEWSYMAP
jgi:serine/threonine protein kinase